MTMPKFRGKPFREQIKKDSFNRESSNEDDGIKYDESGSASYVFGLSFLLIVLSILTFLFISSIRKSGKKEKKTINCKCPGCVKKEALEEHNKKSRWKVYLFGLILIAGWSVVLYMIYQLQYLSQEAIRFDPYEILELNPGCSPAEIKSAYRRLSLQYHPDKEGGNEATFVRVSKAYKALTDETTRKNLEEYGNPDGPTAVSFGIALPTWVVESKNSPKILILYFVLFIVIFPLIISAWWTKQSRYSSDNVLVETTALYCKKYYISPSMTCKTLLTVLSSSYEFWKQHNPDIQEREDDEINITKLMKTVSKEKIKKPNKIIFFHPFSVKARTLLYCHFYRADLGSSKLNHDLQVILRMCSYLTEELVNCARYLRRKSLHTLENSMMISPMIIQATFLNHNTLLELPHVKEEMIGKRTVKGVLQLMQLPEEKRREALPFLKDDEYEDAIEVASQIPFVQVDIEFKEIDEDQPRISTEQSITVKVKLKRRPLGQINQEAEGAEDTQEGESEEKESKKIVEQHKTKKKAVKNRRSKPIKKEAYTKKNRQLKNRSHKVQHQESENEEQTEASDEEDDDDFREEMLLKDMEEIQIQKQMMKKPKKGSPQVHCPYFPQKKEECWWIYACDRKKNLIMSATYSVKNLMDETEIKIQLFVEDPGSYYWSVMVRSDSYACAVYQSKCYKLEVTKAKEAPEIREKEEIDEDDDDDDEEECASDTDEDDK